MQPIEYFALGLEQDAVRYTNHSNYGSAGKHYPPDATGRLLRSRLLICYIPSLLIPKPTVLKFGKVVWAKLERLS